VAVKAEGHVGTAIVAVMRFVAGLMRTTRLLTIAQMLPRAYAAGCTFAWMRATTVFVAGSIRTTEPFETPQTAPAPNHEPLGVRQRELGEHGAVRGIHAFEHHRVRCRGSRICEQPERAVAIGG
jgi:hypothetical protein